MRKLKVVVDFDLCISNAVCANTAPKVFEVDDEGYLQILQEYPDDDVLESVKAAVVGCPTGAIALVEEA